MQIFTWPVDFFTTLDLMFMKAEKYIYILLFFYLTSFSKKPPVSTFYLSLADETIKAQAISEKTIITTEQSKTYYWYSHNSIHQTQGGYDGRILHGEYSSFYLSNQLKEKGRFYKGLKHQRWSLWYENGKLHEIYHWKKGVLNGIHQVYDENGVIVLEENYNNGLLDGKQKIFENGKLKSTKCFNNGKEKELKEKKSFFSFKKKKQKTDSSEKTEIKTKKEAKQKKEKKVKPATTPETVKKEDKENKEKNTFFKKITSVFKKKEKR